MSKKIYTIQSILDAKRASRTGPAYPPDSATNSQNGVTVKRSFSLSTYEVSVGGARWLAALPIGAERTRLVIRFTVGGLSNTDTRTLIADFYFGALSGAMYTLDGTNGAFSRALSTLANGQTYEIDLSNWIAVVPSNNYFGLRFWIDADDPTGLNELTLTNLEIDDYYTLTLAPIRLAIDGDESNGIFINRTLEHDFTFVHQDDNEPPLAMIAGQIRYKRQSESEDDYVTITISSSQALWTAAANTFTSGADNTWVWSARSKSAGEADYGPWSTAKTFIATADIDTPVVTAPTGQIDEPNPTITATSSEGTRTAYQARVRNQATSAVVYDSMEVPGTGLSQLVSTNLPDGEYFADFRVKVDGVWSQYGSEEFSVVLDPPATPTLFALPVPESGAINLTYTSEDEVEILVSPDYNPNNPDSATWVSIVDGLEPSEEGAVYQYFEAGNNKQLHFKAVAHADNVSSIPSDVVDATLPLNGIWIHKLNNPAGSIRHYAAYEINNNPTRWLPKWKPETSLHYFAGREGPVVNRGEHKTKTCSFTLQLVTDGSEHDEGLQVTEALLQAEERVCVRTMEYNKVFIGSILGVDGPFSDSNKLNHYTVNFEMVVTG